MIDDALKASYRASGPMYVVSDWEDSRHIVVAAFGGFQVDAEDTSRC